VNTPSENEIMAENSDQTDKPEENLDLSGLSSMSLGPDWVSGKKPHAQFSKEMREDRPRPRGGPHKDRRGFKPRRPGAREGGGRPNRPYGGPPSDRRDREPFQPVVEVDFYPEEEPFRVLAQAIRTSFRTYELFEIARLILDKQDRFVCLVRDPAQKEGEQALLYASVPDGLPFRSEEEALGHVFLHYMGEFFEQDTLEVDPPSGSFQMVHKCGMTGDILGAPNYHRYQALCREHHAAKLGNVPYSRFEQRIESSREEEDIQAWLDKMKTQTRYILKENRELIFNNAEDARLYLVTQSKDQLVRPAYSARFSGKTLALLNPSDPIRKSVEVLLENQVKFPLETANHLRGRLRRMHFAVYKRGSKGISFVCAIKRRFRRPDEVLADNLQELIDFLEAHQNFPAKELPKTYLGIDPDRKPVVESTPAAEEVTKEVTESTPAADEVTKEVTEGTEALPEPAKEEESTEPAEESTQPAEEKPSPKAIVSSTEDDARAIQQLKMDLRYLVSEGYVTEFSDGRLFVPGIREEEIRHIEKQKEKAAMEEAVKSASEAPVAETPEKAEAAAEEKPAVESEKPAETVEPEVAPAAPVPEPEAVPAEVKATAVEPEATSTPEIEPEAVADEPVMVEPIVEAAEPVEVAPQETVPEVEPEAVAPAPVQPVAEIPVEPEPQPEPEPEPEPKLELEPKPESEPEPEKNPEDPEKDAPKA